MKISGYYYSRWTICFREVPQVLKYLCSQAWLQYCLILNWNLESRKVLRKYQKTCTLLQMNHLLHSIDSKSMCVNLYLPWWKNESKS